jgi:5-methyltetrahydropteroyltriglutamate--homocysteine methyltransferase
MRDYDTLDTDYQEDRAMITARSDIVGSLLRPPELLAAQTALRAGDISRAEFKFIEDRAVDFCIKLQEDAGLDAVTDGEMRRLSFQSQIVQAVDGFGQWDIDAFLWGDWKGDDAVGDQNTGRPAELGAVSKLVRRRHLTAEEFTYARARAARPIKVTLTSPSLFANLWSPELSRDAYPTLDSFLADVTAILRQEVEELARLGCTYIQIDAPHYPLLIDPKTRAFYEDQGWSIDDWLDLGIGLDNQLMEGIEGVTFSFHLCRGNQGSRWLVEGGYDTIARPVFQGIKAHRLMLEYDDERSGDFTPLADVPDDKTVVLGLVTTKSGALEDPDALARRIDDAARYIPLERLAISPQCGFATSIGGNALTIDEQRAKLEVMCGVARRVWG